MTLDPKSAGVPAGATRVCTGCGQYWDDTDWPCVEIVDPGCPCTDLRPIAEAGPAPTTAAPAELPNRREFHASTPAEFAAAAKVAQGGDTIIVPDWPLPREAAPAEQPGKADEGDHADDCTDPNCHKRHTITAGKAADPRKHSTVKCACGRFDVGIATVQPAWNVEGSTSVRHTQEACGRYGAGVVLPQATDPSPAKPPIVVCATWPQTLHAEDSHPCSDPRPAQPQAPAEPSKEQFDKAGRVLAAVMDAERRGENMDPIIARALAAEAATLREERDRLAEELETAEARLSTARGQAEAFAKTAREAWAKVAERDARIAALTARAEGALALAETYRKAWRTALGVPEENT